RDRPAARRRHGRTVDRRVRAALGDRECARVRAGRPDPARAGDRSAGLGRRRADGRARAAGAMTSGFSLVEMTIAMALTLSLAASIFTLAQASRGSVTTQSEIADQQQRARAGVDALARDLMNAGAGSYVGVNPGPLNASLPAVLPFRRTVAG